MYNYAGAIRQVKGLKWAAEQTIGPFASPTTGKHRVSVAAGLRYERAVGSALGQCRPRAGVWHRFVDANGPGWCQPDWIVQLPGCELIIECKLTWNAAAVAQLQGLYKPVREFISGKPAVGVVVCKNLSRATPTELLCDSLDECLDLARTGQTPLLHWMGKEPFPLRAVAPAEGREAKALAGTCPISA